MLEKITTYTKSQLMDISDEITAPVLNNEVNALDVDLKLKAAEDIIKDARNKIKGKVKDEVSEIESIYGVKVSIRNGYATLDYSIDETYRMLSEQLKQRKELLDQAFKLKERGQELVIDSELIPVVPVKSYTSDSVVYNFK